MTPLSHFIFKISFRVWKTFSGFRILSAFFLSVFQSVTPLCFFGGVAYIATDKKSAAILICYFEQFFSPFLALTLWYSLVWWSSPFLHSPLLLFLLLILLVHWNIKICAFIVSQNFKFFRLYFFKSSGTSLDLLVFSHSDWCFDIFSLFHFLVSITMPTISLIFSSAVSSSLVIPTCIFFISDNIFSPLGI